MKAWRWLGAIAIVLPFVLWPARANAVNGGPSSDTLTFTSDDNPPITFTIPELNEGGPGNLIVSQIIDLPMPTIKPSLPLNPKIKILDPNSINVSDTLNLNLSENLTTHELAIGINAASDSETPLSNPDFTVFSEPGLVVLTSGNIDGLGGLKVTFLSDPEAPPAQVPEPGTLALVTSGLVGVAWRQRKHAGHSRKRGAALPVSA